MSSALILTGEHPAAPWLALALARRGWTIGWADQASRPGGDWWGMSQHLLTWLGEPVPVWPLELCAQQLDGLARLGQGVLLELLPWPAALLDLKTYWRDLETEMQALALPRWPRSVLDASAARVGTLEAVWCLEIAYDTCRGNCRSGSEWTERQGLLASGFPAGLLEIHSGAGERLALAALDSGQTCFSYLLQTGYPDRLPDRLHQFLPGSEKPARWKSGRSVTQRPVCRCLPRLTRQQQHLRIGLPLPGLQPESLLIQSMAWAQAQALLRWLSEDLLILDRLDAHLEAYAHKLEAAVASLVKTHTFLEIPF